METHYCCFIFSLIKVLTEILIHSECTGSDLLESILGVLFQLTEERNFKLVSHKQQLGTQSEGAEEMKKRLV